MSTGGKLTRSGACAGDQAASAASTRGEAPRRRAIPARGIRRQAVWKTIIPTQELLFFTGYAMLAWFVPKKMGKARPRVCGTAHGGVRERRWHTSEHFVYKRLASTALASMHNTALIRKLEAIRGECATARHRVGCADRELPSSMRAVEGERTEESARIARLCVILISETARRDRIASIFDNSTVGDRGQPTELGVLSAWCWTGEQYLTVSANLFPDS